MTAKATIISEINSKTSHDHTIYRIGITHDPNERKTHWTSKGSTTYWKQWQADSLSDAQAIETYFIREKKMKGGEGGDMSSSRPTHVYVF
jgi:hypothetical protein